MLQSARKVTINDAKICFSVESMLLVCASVLNKL